MRVPLVEALDGSGAPCLRRARVVGELPTPRERKAALVRIATALGVDGIPFGAPFYHEWSRAQIRAHGDIPELHVPGADLPLTLLATQ